jgi:succinoglycan biosynthesis transport protein ExoP
MSTLASLDAFARSISDPTTRTILTSEEGFDLYRAVDNEAFLQHGKQNACIGVVSARPREGRSTIALLCAALAAAHAPRHRILLLDASFGGRGCSAHIGIANNHPGINDYCQGNASFDDCIVHSALSNLDFVAGNADGPPPKLLQTEFADFIAEARKRYQCVVVDTPSGSENRDLISMAKLLDHVLIIVRYGFATREQIQPLVAELKRHDISILGAIMNQRIFSIPQSFYGK